MKTACRASRRVNELKKISPLFGCLLAGLLLSAPDSIAQHSTRVWIGASEGGIYAGEFDLGNGHVNNLRPVVEGIDGYYIVRHPSKPVLYAILRTEGPGSIVSYLIAPDGGLSLQSEIKDRPHGASHINISDDGRFIAVAYFRTGITGLYRLDDEGRITTEYAEAQHEGKGPVPDKQWAPHPHWAGFSSDTRFLYVPDLGTDEIWVYRVQAQQPMLGLVQKARAPAGSGPRHMAVHPVLDMVYVSDELPARVSRYALNRDNGELAYLDSMPPAPEAAGEIEHTVSDIRIHPSGRFLYLVNRGFDRVSVYAIDPLNGELTPIEREPVRGSISRNMALTADGQWALVAGQLSNTLAVFRVDTSTGELTYANQMASVPTPMAIVIEN